MPTKSFQSQLKDKRPQIRAVLDTLEKIVTDYFWTFHMDYMDQFHKMEVRRPFVLQTFGSYELGTDDEKSDIDLVLCTYGSGEDVLMANDAESFIDLKTFFGEFFDHLKSQKAVRASKIEDATVPLIKIEIDGVSIDLLLCAKLPYAESLTNTEHTTCRASLYSILGYQACKTFKEVATNLSKSACGDLAPSAGLYVFGQVCRLVKKFCRQRQIYGSNLCFLNGVTIQIMVLLAMEIIYEEDFNINR
jgi:poly(A) polymerase Pap1